MEVIYNRSFLKQYEKLDPKIERAFEKRITIFQVDPFAELLDNHRLIGKYIGFRSINITGDFRAIYKEMTENVAEFYYIGTHSQLYK